MTSSIQLVGFDGDDTLWHSEGYYQQAYADFEAIVGEYVDLRELALRQRLLTVERANLALFGYGAKGMALSMVEAAIRVTEERISAHDLHRIVELGKQILRHPVELLEGVRAAVEAVAADYPVVLVTKGDLFHQEQKVALSGLADLFARIEIVSEKDPATYAGVLARSGVAAESFVMVGNSLRSDIAPVLELGGRAIHIPYHLLWLHEADAQFEPAPSRMAELATAADIPEVLRAWSRPSAVHDALAGRG
ncbi:HAD family hydrolase [Frateuria aurantia]